MVTILLTACWSAKNMLHFLVHFILQTLKWPSLNTLHLWKCLLPSQTSWWCRSGWVSLWSARSRIEWPQGSICVASTCSWLGPVISLYTTPNSTSRTARPHPLWSVMLRNSDGSGAGGVSTSGMINSSDAMMMMIFRMLKITSLVPYIRETPTLHSCRTRLRVRAEFIHYSKVSCVTIE